MFVRLPPFTTLSTPERKTMSGVHDVEVGSFSSVEFLSRSLFTLCSSCNSRSLVQQQCRIRHVTIQVRNLTPYPVRDTFASALAQVLCSPLVRRPRFDLTHSRRRSRRISANSINTLWSTRSEEGSGEDANSSSVAATLRAGERQGRESVSLVVDVPPVLLRCGIFQHQQHQ